MSQGFLLNIDQFNFLLFVMAISAVIVFVVLYFVEAGYGKAISDKWGPAINNKVAWILMEVPAFLVLLYIWLQSGDRKFDLVPFLLFFLFELHYLHIFHKLRLLHLHLKVQSYK